MKKISDVSAAKNYLAVNFPEAFTPDRVKEVLGLLCSAATLGRKFRAAAQNGELVKCYYCNARGEEIAQYSHNANLQQPEDDHDELVRKAEQATAQLNSAHDKGLLFGVEYLFSMEGK